MAQQPDNGAAEMWREAVERFSDGVRQTIEFQRKLVSGRRPDLEMPDLSEAYARFLRSDLAGYGKRVAELTIDYYKALGEAARDYGEQFWEQATGRRSGESAAAERPRHSLEVSGATGTEVTKSFTLENTNERAAEVKIDVGVCRSPHGEAFTAPVTVEPDQLTIPPGGSTTVAITTSMREDLFEPGIEYRVPISLEGPQPAVIDLHIRSTAGTGTEPAQPDSKSGFAVQCPACERTFERKTDDLRLRPHKTPDGHPCEEREGRRA